MFYVIYFILMPITLPAFHMQPHFRSRGVYYPVRCTTQGLGAICPRKFPSYVVNGLPCRCCRRNPRSLLNRIILCTNGPPYTVESQS
ncbi:hypothetical protein RIF29_17046 [Crotalaria pallida]|uniref:Secreted protein n=1 Tax=Crotalaria pallida TaxID=3830 RepID=A0AAN9IG35_CROPI